MTVTHMEIRDCFGEKLPLLNLDRTRDALAAMVERRWPSGRRKAVMKEWDLSDDEARSVCSGRCSWATFDKIITHKRGGWRVLFPVFGALLDETAEHFIVRERKAHAEHAKRLGALVGDWWPMAADRDAGPDHLDHEPHRRRIAHGR
jgi:hypothetical protein